MHETQCFAHNHIDVMQYTIQFYFYTMTNQIINFQYFFSFMFYYYYIFLVFFYSTQQLLNYSILLIRFVSFIFHSLSVHVLSCSTFCCAVLFSSLSLYFNLKRFLTTHCCVFRFLQYFFFMPFKQKRMKRTRLKLNKARKNTE